MLRTATLPPGERLETTSLAQGGSEVHHVTLDAAKQEVRRLVGILLDGEQSASLTASMITTVLATGDRVTAACHKAYGLHYPTNQDRIAINVDGSTVTGIDGYGGDGAIVASALGNGMLFDDIHEAAALTVASVPDGSQSGACFASVRITKDAAGAKVLEPTQAGDVHMLVLDEQGKLVWESEDQDLASILARNGTITPDEALYNQYRSTVTNSIGDGSFSLTRSPSIALKPGYRVIVASDGVFDNLTTPEFFRETAGLDAAGIIGKMEAVVIPRMQNSRAIRAASPDRETTGQYSDGFRSKPKGDNMSIAVIDIV